jgi:ParB/RepB/Spo0J family partition protein
MDSNSLPLHDATHLPLNDHGRDLPERAGGEDSRWSPPNGQSDTSAASGAADQETPEKSPGDNGQYELLMIPVAQLVENKNQPRQSARDSRTRKELGQSIRQFGVKKSLLVRRIGENEYEVIDGYGRLAAAKEAGFSAVPCLLEKRAETENEELRLQYQTNQLHERLSPLDQAKVFQRLMSTNDWTQTQVAKFLGTSQSCVSPYLTVLTTGSDAEKAKVQSGELNVKIAARAINDREKRKKAKKKAASKDAPASEDAADSVGPVPSPNGKPKGKQPANLIAYDEFAIKDERTGLWVLVLGKNKKSPPKENALLALEHAVAQLKLEVKHDV